MMPTNCLLLGNGIAVIVQTHESEKLNLQADAVPISVRVNAFTLDLKASDLTVSLELVHLEHMINNGTSVYVYLGNENQYTLDFAGEIRLERDMLIEAKGMIKSNILLAQNAGIAENSEPAVPINQAAVS